jgi:hypothetical protein
MRIAATLLTLTLITSSSRADDTADFLKKDNWEGLLEYWTIEGTTVTGKSEKGLSFNTFLCSKPKYGDFELKCKVRLKGGKGNSGFQVRSEIADAKKFAVKGPQCDVGEGYWGSLYGELFGGMMKEAPKDKVNEKLKKDDFNDYHIKVEGKHVTILVNGITAVDQEFPKLPESGIIALQLHAGRPMEVTFKDIEFKVIKK